VSDRYGGGWGEKPVADVIYEHLIGER